MKATIIIWLCGLWSVGLGARMSLELLLSDSGIYMPRNVGYGVNIWFDFIPFCIFGLVTVYYTTKELFIVVQKKGWVDV